MGWTNSKTFAPDFSLDRFRHFIWSEAWIFYALGFPLGAFIFRFHVTHFGAFVFGRRRAQFPLPCTPLRLHWSLPQGSLNQVPTQNSSTGISPRGFLCFDFASGPKLGLKNNSDTRLSRSQRRRRNRTLLDRPH